MKKRNVRKEDMCPECNMQPKHKPPSSAGTRWKYCKRCTRKAADKTQKSMDSFVRTMKAISIKEPWATRILKGGKTIETRTWRTGYRGKLLLCASRYPESDISGNAYAVADLVDCRPMRKEDEAAAMCKRYSRAYSWILRDIKPIKPFDVMGQLGLFTVDIRGKIP